MANSVAGTMAAKSAKLVFFLLNSLLKLKLFCSEHFLICESWFYYLLPLFFTGQRASSCANSQPLTPVETNKRMHADEKRPRGAQR